MRYDPEKHHRRSIRLQGYDYRQGLFFLTICTYQREQLFGEVVDTTTKLNRFGEIVQETWEWLPLQYPSLELDICVVMPDHFHGLLFLEGAFDNNSKPEIKTLGHIVKAMKSVSGKKINILRETPGASVWQRNYYEHVVRDEADLARIREYITNNPANSEADLNKSWG
ncbi:MAG: transposase [Chloroflexi bacterium]|uniref:Transposase n=1 Tax=Candidatus Chlorohelix allophototropha TaxID=3003348 RepID=A0A8T7MAQ9_9CHLR|nr:transposase [Chloroflexota bacterium]NWJ49215.1 transposase [Chloroflexota bacterium]WJW68677.1 transposase [Chloroflexota bacterium L227-S17]